MTLPLFSAFSNQSQSLVYSLYVYVNLYTHVYISCVRTQLCMRTLSYAVVLLNACVSVRQSCASVLPLRARICGDAAKVSILWLQRVNPCSAPYQSVWI